MSIKSDILEGMRKSRKTYFRSDELDDFAVEHYQNGEGGKYFSAPEPHSVRARISELASSGEILRTLPNQYTLGDRDEDDIY